MYSMFYCVNDFGGKDLGWERKDIVSNCKDVVIIGTFNDEENFIKLVKDNGFSYRFRDEKELKFTANRALNYLNCMNKLLKEYNIVQ